MPGRSARSPLTPLEREARRQADRDRLEDAARALLTSDGWQRWIRVRSKNGLSRYTVVISGRPRQRRCPGRLPLLPQKQQRRVLAEAVVR
jgi:hypothetical protein